MSIRCKKDLVQAFGVHRDTFYKTVLPSLLNHLDWTEEQYKKHHKKHFLIEDARKINEFVKTYQEII